MKRRQLLAALSAGASGAIAGCGYAYGGGDVRDETMVMTGGFGSRRFAIDSDRIVAARSGRMFHDDGFGEGTEVSVANRSGDTRWSYTHRSRSEAVAVGELVYLLDKRGYVVAIDRGPDETSGDIEERSADGTEKWRVMVENASPPLVADERGAYVGSGNGVAAVRDGNVVWQHDLPGEVESLHVAGDTILAATRATVVALDRSGSERWRIETDGNPDLAAGGRLVAIRGDGQVHVYEVKSGEERWSADVDGSRGRLAMTPERVYTTDHAGSRAYDASTGNLEWEHASAVPDSPLFATPESVYGIRTNCQVVAVGASGTRWTREVDDDACSLVGGWLDGETVALLFESGYIRWFQRTDQEPGLL